MASSKNGLALVKSRAKTYYARWIEKEAIPIIEGFGVPDARKIKLGAWKRLSCAGAYLQLKGLEGITGVYVGEISPGGALEPEKHLYEEVIYIIQGEGVAEMQQQGRVPQAFKWRSGSLFSPP